MVAQNHVLADDAEGPDLTVHAEQRVPVDQGAGMDHRGHIGARRSPSGASTSGPANRILTRLEIAREPRRNLSDRGFGRRLSPFTGGVVAARQPPPLNP